jgi:antirestriction protein ArdC
MSVTKRQRNLQVKVSYVVYRERFLMQEEDLRGAKKERRGKQLKALPCVKKATFFVDRCFLMWKKQ